MARGRGAAEGAVDMGLKLRMRGEERRIASQHERLDDLCRELYARIGKEGATAALGEFVLFETALDAHMSVEEEIYFPALHGLRTDIGPELSNLVEEHDLLRSQAAGLEQLLRAGDAEAARQALDRLARDVSTHEQLEEALIARITEGPVAPMGHSSLEA